MRQRLSSASRQRRQAWAARAKWGIFGLMVLTIFVGGKTALEAISQPMGMMVTNIHINTHANTANRTPEQAVKNALHAQHYQSMGLFNVAEARTTLENMPWVRAALVTKQWPNTLKVSLYEHTPLALMQQTNTAKNRTETWVMAKSGDLIIPARNAPNLRNLTRVSGNPPLATATHMVRQAGTANTPLRTATWHGTETMGHWRLQANTGHVVQATPRQVAKSLQHLEHLTAAITTLDTRVPGRVYYTEKGA